MSSPRPATIVSPTGGEYTDVVGDRYRILATRESTNGKYGLFEATVPPGGGPPPHVHSREEEGFYVIEGEVAIYVDGQRVVAGPGAFVNMPVGSTHRFCNESDRPVRMLILVAPGGMEGMFKETGTMIADPVSPITPKSEEGIHRLIATAPKYGIELKLPPPAEA